MPRGAHTCTCDLGAARGTTVGRCFLINSHQCHHSWGSTNGDGTYKISLQRRGYNFCHHWMHPWQNTGRACLRALWGRLWCVWLSQEGRFMLLPWPLKNLCTMLHRPMGLSLPPITLLSTTDGWHLANNASSSCHWCSRSGGVHHQSSVPTCREMSHFVKNHFIGWWLMMHSHYCMRQFFLQSTVTLSERQSRS